jgi:hypothetical protein
VATLTCSPSWRSCSCAAGRRVSSEAIGTFVLAVGKAPGDLCRSGRLAGTLQANHHDDDRSRRIEVDGNAVGAEHVDQLVMDDLDDHLSLDRLQHRGINGLLTHLVGEGTHHFQRHVGLEQRAAHFAQCGRDIRLRQRAAAVRPFRMEPRRSCSDSNILFPWHPDGAREVMRSPRVSNKSPCKRKAKKHPGRITLPGVGLRICLWHSPQEASASRSACSEGCSSRNSGRVDGNRPWVKSRTGCRAGAGLRQRSPSRMRA